MMERSTEFKNTTASRSCRVLGSNNVLTLADAAFKVAKLSPSPTIKTANRAEAFNDLINMIVKQNIKKWDHAGSRTRCNLGQVKPRLQRESKR